MDKVEYLKDKRIAVTGGGGFLGTFVVKTLAAFGVKQQNIFVPRKKDYDLVQPGAISRMLDDGRPDIIFHLAALAGGIGVNMDRPAEFFYENIMMGVPLMHQAKEYGVEKFIALGTICAYPESLELPFKEDDLWKGYPEKTNAPYGLAKKMLLVQAQAYRRQYNFNAIYLLPVNLYGPGDNFDPKTSHVIPALIRKFVEAKEKDKDSVDIWGDGSPTREFLYVEDAARGIVLAGEHYDDSQPVNLGSGEEINIRNLAKLIAKLTEFKGKFNWLKDRPNGQPRRRLDVTRAEKLFGFRATTGFEEGLRKTIDWYRKYRKELI